VQIDMPLISGGKLPPISGGNTFASRFRWFNHLVARNHVNSQ
jgi:hypothetical protein